MPFAGSGSVTFPQQKAISFSAYKECRIAISDQYLVGIREYRYPIFDMDQFNCKLVDTAWQSLRTDSIVLLFPPFVYNQCNFAPPVPHFAAHIFISRVIATHHLVETVFNILEFQSDVHSLLICLFGKGKKVINTNIC